MNPDWLERTELLIGENALQKLQKSKVLIVGLGGVGSFAAEFIARSGVGSMTIVDGDTVDKTNKNRQLPALDSTTGHKKAKVMADRIMDINPDIRLTVIDEFQKPEDNISLIQNGDFDYVMDCIDSVTPKLTWLVACKRLKVKVISHLGAGGKMDPSRVQVTQLNKTYNCKLASHLKKRLN